MRHHKQCFHCAEAMPAGPPIYASLGDMSQPVCCIGCKAVAEFIHDSGLDSFYRHRTRPTAALGLRASASDWQFYDDADLLARYVHNAGGQAETTIDIGGMYCSACVWLLENTLARLQSIQRVSVAPATRRAVIRWDPSTLRFSQLLEAIAQVGFKPSPTAAGLADSGNEQEQRSALRRLIVSAAAGMQVMMFAVALYAGEHYGIEGRIEQFLRVISMLVCVPIVFYSARPFFAGAYRGLRAGSPGMDLPVAIAVAVAFAASLRATILGSGDIYFDSVAMFVLFLSAARYLEMRTRHRSEDYTQALARLLPETVTRLGDRQPEVIAADKLRPGDVVLIRSGDVIPADGQVLSGDLAIDESLLTGESVPVTRAAGMQVFAGGINRNGSASIEITLTGASTSLAEIGRLLERARADRPPIALLADRVARKFIIAVLTIAAVTGVVWLGIDSSRAFEVVLATLVVTCPCALSLATPAALAAATSRLARDGFLLVRSRVLEVLTRADTIIFDKTGTLTQGRPVVVETQLLRTGGSSAEQCLMLAAALESVSEHVLARAFSGHYVPGKFFAEHIVTEQGAGIEAVIDGLCYRVGSAAYVCELSAATVPDEFRKADQTRVYLGDENGLLAAFSIGDELRADAAQAISDLKRLRYNVVIASGDSEAVVAGAANALGIDRTYARYTPVQKLELVSKLQQDGHTVVMVGDGINDSPVLAAADTSIAIDAGTALARASADAVLLGKRLNSIVDAAVVAAKTRKIIRQNILWAVVYNITAVPLAASGMLAPWLAAIGMSASSLLVVVNALRLQRVDVSKQSLAGVASADAVSRKALV